MKKLLILCFLILFSSSVVFADESGQCNCKVFASEDKEHYGLKEEDNIVTDAIYRKVIKLGDNAWIIQNKRQKFGLMDCNGEILVKPKYSHAERLFDKWVKLGNTSDYGIYDEYGTAIVPPEFQIIEPLFGHKFLTCKHYKYGVYSDDGKLLLSNKYQFIYMPSPKVMRIKHNHVWYEIERTSDGDINLTDEMFEQNEDSDLKITQIIVNTGIGAGYGVVTATDYTLKILSTFSNAYEDTIDELTLSKGIEAVPVLMKFSWVPKFPVVYAKKYYENLIQPDNSPLSGVRNDIKQQIK